MSEPPGNFEDLQRVNQLLDEVENLVAHRLSEEHKNELKSCNEKLREDPKSASTKKPVDCDELEKLSKDLSTELSPSQCFNSDFQPQPSAPGNSVSSQFAGPTSQVEEDAAPRYQDALFSESCDNPSSHDVLSMLDPIDLSGIVLPLSPSAQDNLPDISWHCDDDFLPDICGNESSDLKTDHGNIISEEPSERPDSSLDSKTSLPSSNNESVLPGVWSNSESKKDELGENETCEDPSIIPALKSGDSSCTAEPSGRVPKDLGKDNDASVEERQSDQDLDLGIKKTSSFRCYRPSRGRGRGLQRAARQEISTESPVDENVVSGTTCFTLPLASSNPFSVDESSKESDAQLFPTPSASPDSCQSLSESFEYLGHTLSQSKEELQVKDFTLKPGSLIQVHLGDGSEVMLAPDEVKCTDNGRGSLSTSTFSETVIKEDRIVSASKKNPSRRAGAKPVSVTKMETSVEEGAGSKSGLGFNELKQFGGAKCSAIRGIKTRGGKPVSRGRRGIRTIEKVVPSTVHDDIEQAIANLQQSSESKPSIWDTMLSDMWL